MAMFEIEANGETYEIDAPDEAAALRAFKSATGAKPAAQGDPNAKPGSREYADWAAAQAQAGNALPQVSTPPPEFKDPSLSGPMGKFDAGYTSFVNGIPIAGPSLLSGVENLRAMAQGMPVNDVKAEGQAAREANPITSGIGSVAGAILPLAPLAATSVGGRLLGATGSLPSQMLLGGASSGLIAGADTVARGGDTQDAVASGLIGAGVGGAMPLVARGIGAAWNGITGKGVSAEAKQLGQALKDDEIVPAAIPQMLKDMGEGSMPADLGPNMQQLAGGLASTPGVAQKTLRDAIAARSKGDTARVAKDIAETVGVAPDIDTLRTQIIAAQSAAADPLYKAIRDVPIPTLDGDFFEIFSTPLGKSALQQGLKDAANDGVKFQSRGLTAGMVDYAKRALDDIAGEAFRGGRNNAGRQASNLARRLAAATDQIVPQYKAAREAFAGPAQILDAIETGTTVLTKEVSPMQLQGMLQKMTQGERDALLQGVQHEIASLLGNSTNDVLAVRNLLRKPFNEGKLRILLGGDVTDDLLKRIDRQFGFGTTRDVVTRNSESARRLAAQARVNPDLKDLNTGGDTTLIGIVVRAINAARTGIRGKVQPQTNAKMASFLAAGGDAIDPRMLAQITRGMKPQGPQLLTPASGGLLADEMMAGNRRKPVEITVTGGAR